uniref:Uncharacterized protein n=1 Tax=Panagrolaimus superbus TaxID=310955 RepID=A0A914YER1_9BILA
MNIYVKTFFIILTSSFYVSEIYAASDNVGCPNRVFLGCVLRLKAQRVPFEKNILNVIFNIGSEARLMHTCKAYSEIMPCFRDKILECGNDKQRRMLNEVGKTLMFLCSPFSVERQKLLMKHQKCVGEILALPATVGCKLHDSYHGKQLLKCREACSQKPTDFTCMLKTWISEQNVCTLRDIHDKCGPEASLFYTDMQSTVFEPLFPVLCDFPPQVTASPVVLPSITTPFSENLATTQISPRTIISIPAPPNGNMIQPPRIRPFSRGNVKHKPIDARPLPFWTPQLSTPKPELQTTWKSEYYGNQRYSVTVMPFTADPSPKHYPLISLFKKILPGNLPEKFSFLFEKNNEFEKIPVQKTDKPMPIAAKEIYEISEVNPTTSSTASEEGKFCVYHYDFK